MRYGSKYTYDQSSSKFNKRIFLAVIVCIVLIAAVVLIVLRMNHIRQNRDDSDVVSLAMEDGRTIKQDIETGDVCLLTMPSAVDMKEVEFTSTDPEVVRVDPSGHTDALSVGKATVTAKARNFAAQCEFTVTENTDPARPDEVTTAIKANEEILEKNQKSGKRDIFSITVNRRTNTVTVYTKNDKGEFTVPVRAMVCSCGKGGNFTTVTGSFAIYFQEPWHPLYDEVYGMFVSGFKDDFLFHSVPYETARHDALEAEEFNKLGEPASQGCVRMMVSDVYWIMKNCDIDTPVIIIDADADADPLGKPASVKIPADAKWDPTDDTEGNPYRNKMPEIIGADDVAIAKGESFDPLDGVTAKDICGNDITDKLKVAGGVIPDKPGVYYLTYTIVDNFHLKTRITREVTVSG